MKRMIVFIALGVVLVAGRSSHAQVRVFENDFQGWITQAGEDTTLIDFESIPGSTTTPINGDEFSSRPGAPIISLVEGTGVFVGNPSTNQIPNPPSGVNMLSPENASSIEGILKIEFNQPVRAVGATFVDVEADFSSTGFSTDIGAAFPTVPFSNSQGQGTFSFLGFVSETAFTEVEIHFATGSNIDGTLLDDLTYSFNVLTSNEHEPVRLQDYDLSSAYPNPHASRSSVNLTLRRTQHVKVEVFNVLGNRVAVLQDGILAPKEHVFTFRADALPSGMYQIRVIGDYFVATRRSVLVR